MSTLAVVRSVAELRALVGGWRRAGLSVGLVPTMGALHEGHLVLVRRAMAENARTMATLFVNPRQFGPGEDFATYPRDEAADVAALERVGAHALYAPPVGEMYPPGFATTVSVSGVSERLCGPFRPGHFAGVATVVTKLLLQAAPDAAYFGEKDYQQLLVVQRLARDLDLPVRIVGVPTVREPDGLALSSRNRYLTPQERARAAALPRVLRGLVEALAAGCTSIAAGVADARAALLAAGFDRLDYLEVADAETLEPAVTLARPARAFAAAWIGRTRLIDNMPIPPAAS
ncbi:MAG: pantoate--beta-alanine ligase [Rhodospirillaceae bacterium]|nr:pantoate--beta-alanine ligase [Rhodospirillaceae bacterium]